MAAPDHSRKPSGNVHPYPRMRPGTGPEDGRWFMAPYGRTRPASEGPPEQRMTRRHPPFDRPLPSCATNALPPGIRVLRHLQRRDWWPDLHAADSNARRSLRARGRRPPPHCPYDKFRDQEHPFRQPPRRAAVRAAGAGCAGRCAGHARSCSGHGCGGAGGCRSRDGDGRGGRCAPRGRGMRAHRWRIESYRSCRCRLRGRRYGVGVHASGAGQRGVGRSRGPCHDDGGPGLCR